MVIFASEDIGNADPGAMRVALMPRTRLSLLGYGGVCISAGRDLWALAPKSNTALTSYTKAHSYHRDRPCRFRKLKNATSGLNKSLVTVGSNTLLI